MSDPLLDLVRQRTAESIAAKQAFLERQAGVLVAAAGEAAARLERGGKLLLFGNGGSAADAQHIAAEFVNRMGYDRPAIAALALTTDSSALTSIANDSAYERIFARQIEALGRPEDVALGISTSGNSPNVLAGLETAEGRGLLTIGLLGRDGGKCRARCRYPILVPVGDTQRIQEVHILAGHLFAELVEARLHPRAGS